MRIQTTFLATLLTAVAIFATNCAAQSQLSEQIQTNPRTQVNQGHSSQFYFEADKTHSNSNQLANPVPPNVTLRRSLSPTEASQFSWRRTNNSVAANFETTSSNDLLVARPSTRRNSIAQPSPVNTHELQSNVESPSSRRTNIFGIDEDQCCDEWENFTACGGLKTNLGHYGIPWLTGKDNCEAQHGRGCPPKRSRLGCVTSNCGSTAIECTKLKGITGWFKKSDCRCHACEPVQSRVVEYVQER